MIDKREILETASTLGLLPNVVEKDYVLGWLLAGIDARSDSGGHRSYRVDRLQVASVTTQTFSPRYLVELSSGGPLAVAPTTARTSSVASPSWGTRTMSRPRRAAPSRSDGPTYVFRCTVCGKTFNRKSMDGSLNPHKNPRGNDCYGTYGTYVRTKF